VLQVRVVLDRVRRDSRLCLGIGEFACRRCLHRLESAHSLVPPSDVVHVAHHRGGPFHFVTIFGIRSFAFAEWLVRRSARGRRHPPLGRQAAGGHRGRLAASLWAPASLSRWLNGESDRHCLNRWHEGTPGAGRQSRIHQAPGSFLEPTALLAAPHPEVTPPNPLARVSAALS